MRMGFRICVFVVRSWAILLCGRVVTQGGWVVVVRVAITEQVLNYPPDVRCGGRQCLCEEEGRVGGCVLGSGCPSGRGQSPVSYVECAMALCCQEPLCLMTVAILMMMRIT